MTTAQNLGGLADESKTSVILRQHDPHHPPLLSAKWRWKLLWLHTKGTFFGQPSNIWSLTDLLQHSSFILTSHRPLPSLFPDIPNLFRIYFLIHKVEAVLISAVPLTCWLNFYIHCKDVFNIPTDSRLSRSQPSLLYADIMIFLYCQKRFENIYIHFLHAILWNPIPFFSLPVVSSNLSFTSLQECSTLRYRPSAHPHLQALPLPQPPPECPPFLAPFKICLCTFL